MLRDIRLIINRLDDSNLNRPQNNGIITMQEQTDLAWTEFLIGLSLLILIFLLILISN